MALDESISENDGVAEDLGIQVVYDKTLEPYLEGTVIDFRTNIFGKGQFQVITGYSC